MIRVPCPWHGGHDLTAADTARVVAVLTALVITAETTRRVPVPICPREVLTWAPNRMYSEHVEHALRGAGITDTTNDDDGVRPPPTVELRATAARLAYDLLRGTDESVLPDEVIIVADWLLTGNCAVAIGLTHQRTRGYTETSDDEARCPSVLDEVAPRAVDGMLDAHAET